MRTSIFFGIAIFGIGLLFSFLAKSLIHTPAPTMMATFATGLATALFVVFSAIFLGMGAGLILHWLLSFSSNWKAFIASVMLAVVSFFVGIGASIGLVALSGWTALQAFFTFLTLSFTLFLTSFVNLFGGTIHTYCNIKRLFKKKR